MKKLLSIFSKFFQEKNLETKNLEALFKDIKNEKPLYLKQQEDSLAIEKKFTKIYNSK